MINNTDFKILLGNLDNSHLIRICHILTAEYISDCKGILRATELLNIFVLFSLVNLWSILCYIALLIRHESCYAVIVNLFLESLEHSLYGVFEPWYWRLPGTNKLPTDATNVFVVWIQFPEQKTYIWLAIDNFTRIKKC